MSIQPDIERELKRIQAVSGRGLLQVDCEVGRISFAYTLGVRASIGKHHFYAVAGRFLELRNQFSH